MASTSTEYIRVAVSATEGGVVVNPTSNPVFFAFPDEGEAIEGQVWYTGSWETAAGQYYARVLLGPDNSGIVLAKGTYQVWVKIDEAIEYPVHKTGLMDIV